MSTGYLRLKVAELMSDSDMSLHKASQAGGFAYPTMHRYWRQPETVESLHGRSIVGLLVDALGMSPDEVESLRFGDVFEVVIDGGKDLAEDGRGRPPAE
jgi:hypothetical protein